MEIKRSFYTPFSHTITVERTEPVDCNLCHSRDYRVIGKEYEYEIRECPNCGLVYVSPQPLADELPKFYEAMYTRPGDEAAAARTLGWYEPHIRQLVMKRCPKGGRYLEVGCGFGLLLKHLADLPFEQTAIEMSEGAISVACRNSPKANIIRTSIADAQFEPASFDCIVAIAVLEHVKDPRKTFERLSGWLAPGGLLIIQVPYVAPYIRLKKWFPWMPVFFEAPRHLYDFSPVTLPRYFAEAGIHDTRVEIARPYAAMGWLAPLLIWGVKTPGLLLYRLSGRRYVYPYASAIVVHGMKGRSPA